MRRKDPQSVFLALLFLPAMCSFGQVKKAAGPAAIKVPLGLDKGYSQYVPKDNALTPAKIELGKMLFFDERLSVDGTVSCATCHHPNFGFSNGVQFSPGFKGQLGNRNSPTTLNRLYSTAQFWDGRAKSLEEQALGPIQSPVEMANTLPGMISNMNKIAGYKPYFKRAFGTEEITPERVAQAIACFERTLLSGNSAFDRFQAGEQKALSESPQRGFAVFMGKGNCSRCHVLPNFTDEQFHNIGVGMDKPNPDLGRYDVTMSQKDKGAFKTPTLREIAETYPYFHDGSAQTLEEVVEHIDKGGIPNTTLDPRIKPLGLTPVEKKDLVQFLKALTGAPLKIERPVLPE
jgi:cytochrome c peroxidase